MNKWYIIIVTLCISSSAFAQGVVRSTLGVSGSSVIAGENELMVQQSVGQSSVIGTVERSGVVTRQGFIQPPVEVTGVILDESTLGARIYPNPVQSSLNVIFTEEIQGEVSFLLYDMLGRTVYDKTEAANQNMTLDMNALSSAQYILLITSGKKQFKANLIKR